MKDYFGPIKKGFGLIPSCLLRFIKKFVVNLWFYACFSLIPISIALVAQLLVLTFFENSNVAITVFKVLAIVGQIIPLSGSLYLSEWELCENNEDSAELCFAICAFVIAMLCHL